MKCHFASLFLLLLMTGVVLVEVASDEAQAETRSDMNADEVQDVLKEKLGYAKGSACGYCTYCKFCKLCDEDCPCETSASKPNCKMCKYCKFCYLCTAVCDTICTPGGFIDTVSASIVSSLPSVDHSEVESDIDSVKTWIDKKKDEL